MADDDLEVGVQLDLAGADEDELDRLTRLLRDELDAVDEAAVELVETPAARERAKGFGLTEIGSLVVTLISSGALGAVANVVVGWLSRDKGRSATLVVDGDSITLTNISSKQQQQLLDEWLARTAAKSTKSGG
jgi:Effector Associated Constant Component 1